MSTTVIRGSVEPSLPVGVGFDGTNIWVANVNSDTVSKINPGSERNGKVSDTFPLLFGPRSQSIVGWPWHWGFDGYGS